MLPDKLYNTNIYYIYKDFYIILYLQRHYKFMSCTECRQWGFKIKSKCHNPIICTYCHIPTCNGFSVWKFLHFNEMSWWHKYGIWWIYGIYIHLHIYRRSRINEKDIRSMCGNCEACLWTRCCSVSLNIIYKKNYFKKWKGNSI